MTAAAPPPQGRVRVVTTERPPRAAVVEPTTRFVELPTETYREAHQWAREQLGRKHPGAVGMLEQEQALLNQYLAAQPRG